MSHEVEMQLGAYALGALDMDERAEVEAHLETCDDCRKALVEYRDVADVLLLAVEPADPPRKLRLALEREIGRAPSGVGFGIKRLQTSVAQIALLGLAALLVVANLLQFAQTRALVDQGEQLFDQQRAGQTALALASYPDSLVVTVQEDSVRGTLVFDPSFPVAVFNAWGLPALPDQEAYQLWLIHPDGGRSTGAIFNANSDRNFVSVLIESQLPLGEYIAMGVTIEPAEGSAGPTGPRVLGADLESAP